MSAAMRYGNQRPIEFTKRIKEELQVIRSIGGANYFLFYHNMVKVANLALPLSTVRIKKKLINSRRSINK